MSIKTVLSFKAPREWLEFRCPADDRSEGGIARVAEMDRRTSAYLVGQKPPLQKGRSVWPERIRELFGERLRIEFWNDDRNRLLASHIQEVLSRKSTPYDLAEQLIRSFK